MNRSSLVTGSAALLLVITCGGCRGAVDLPEPSLEGMEPQVVEAIERSRNAVRNEPRSGELWGRLGLVYHAHGLYDAGARCYQRAAELAPEDFRFWYYRAVVEQRSDRAKALELAKRAEQLSPRSAPVLVLEGTLLEELDSVNEARAIYRKLLEIDPGSAVAAFRLGRIAVTAGDLDEGRRLLERAAALQPRAGAIQAFLSRVYRLQSDFERALDAAERARGLEPEVVFDDPLLEAMSDQAVSTRALQRRAGYAEASGLTSAAEALHRRLVELHPDDAEMRYNFANFLGRHSRSEEAELGYRKALELDEGYVSAYVNLGNLLVAKNALEEGERMLSRAVELEPERPSALVGLSNALAQTGKLELAGELLEKVLSSEPENLSALLGLSQIRAGMGSLTDAALLLERALSVYPDDGRTHFSMAVLQAREGAFERAWYHAQRAERLGFALPDDFRRTLEAAMPRPSLK